VRVGRGGEAKEVDARTAPGGVGEVVAGAVDRTDVGREHGPFFEMLQLRPAAARALFPAVDGPGQARSRVAMEPFRKKSHGAPSPCCESDVWIEIVCEGRAPRTECAGRGQGREEASAGVFLV